VRVLVWFGLVWVVVSRCWWKKKKKKKKKKAVINWYHSLLAQLDCDGAFLGMYVCIAYRSSDRVRILSFLGSID